MSSLTPLGVPPFGGRFPPPPRRRPIWLCYPPPPPFPPPLAHPSQWRRSIPAALETCINYDVFLWQCYGSVLSVQVTEWTRQEWKSTANHFRLNRVERNRARLLIVAMIDECRPYASEKAAELKTELCLVLFVSLVRPPWEQ